MVEKPEIIKFEAHDERYLYNWRNWNRKEHLEFKGQHLPRWDELPDIAMDQVLSAINVSDTYGDSYLLT